MLLAHLIFFHQFFEDIFVLRPQFENIPVFVVKKPAHSHIVSVLVGQVLQELSLLKLIAYTLGVWSPLSDELVDVFDKVLCKKYTNYVSNPKGLKKISDSMGYHRTGSVVVTRVFIVKS